MSVCEPSTLTWITMLKGGGLWLTVTTLNSTTKTLGRNLIGCPHIPMVGSSERANSVQCHHHVWAYVPEELANTYRWTKRVWEISQQVQQVVNSTQQTTNSTKIFSVWNYKSGRECASGTADATSRCRCQKELEKEILLVGACDWPLH